MVQHVPVLTPRARRMPSAKRKRAVALNRADTRAVLAAIVAASKGPEQ